MSENAPESDVAPTVEDSGTVEPVVETDTTAQQLAALRRENANWRTKFRESETSKTEQLKTIAKAMGLADDEADPGKLTEQLTSAKSEARQKALELAVYRAAGKAGVDGDRLLDSRSFLSSVNGLDPSSTDFASALGEAITSSGDRFKTSAAPARSGGEFASAPKTDRQWTREDVERAAAAGKHDDITQARQKGLLRNLLG